MKIVPFETLICPYDCEGLVRSKNAYQCLSHHSFDISKGGYINLLAVQLKRSKNPGDNADMVKARKRIHEAKIFQLLSDVLTQKISIATTSKKSHLNILDAGCGTGHYIDQIRTSLQKIKHPKTLSLIGMDISKQAIQQACKLSHEITWCVASNKSIPIQSGSIDVICNLFGYPVQKEFHRVLTKEGIVISVQAGPNHLIEIRRSLYPNIQEKRKSEFLTHHFSHLSKEQYRNRIILPSERISDLIAMTPHAYKARRCNIQQLIENPPAEFTLDYLIFVDMKNNHRHGQET